MLAVIVRILGHISEAIRLDFETSKRDIFYLDPVGFHSQRVVDRCIDDIAFTIGVSRTVLHVVRVAGPLPVNRLRKVDCRCERLNYRRI